MLRCCLLLVPLLGGCVGVVSDPPAEGRAGTLAASTDDHPYHAPIGASATGRIGGSPHGPRRLRARRPDQQRAIEAGLQWLARLQEPGGGWGAATPLVLLAYLAHGSTTRSGPYRDQVVAAVRHLAAGRVAGQEPDGPGHAALTTWALTEAAVLSRDPQVAVEARSRLRRLVAQHRPDGRWQVPGRDGPPDLAAGRLAHLALQAGVEAGVVDAALEQAVAAHLQTRRPDRLAPSRAAAAWLWDNRSGAQLRAFAASAVADEWVRAEPARASVHRDHLFLATRAMHHVGGRLWQEWCETVLRGVVAAQEPAGPDRGSWAGWYTPYGITDRRTATAGAVLALAASYLYTRIGR